MILVAAPAPPAWLGLVAGPDAVVVAAPRLLRLVVRVWARRRADRRIAGDFLLRAVADRRAARQVSPQVTGIYAASLAAHRTFAAGRTAGATTVLVEDLPDLRQLHADLERAAAAHPDARFLRRHRAGRRWLVRQEVERVLADELVVRSEFARAGRLARGFDPARVRLLRDPIEPAVARPMPRCPTLLLAGPATARCGLYEAIAVADALADVSVVVRVSEGMEPVDALAHPRVRAASEAELDLHGIDLVIAPAWCESDLPEVAAAAARGIPVIATDRAAGTAQVHLVEPGDVAALIQAVLGAVGRAGRV